MRIPRTHADRSPLPARVPRIRARAGFTMVEIALCLGVIGFALVAILGVLPTGIQVQKENREETIVTQDGMVLLEAIRSGSRGYDDLTNYIDEIQITNHLTGAVTVFGTNSTVPTARSSDGLPLTRAGMLVGLLSTPKYEPLPSGTLWRGVTANMRAFSGTAMDKDPGNREFAFRYQVISEVIPFQSMPPESLDYRQSGLSAAVKAQRYQSYLVVTNEAVNFYELRLTLRWPLVRRGAQFVPGENQKTFRTLISGRLEVLNTTPRLYHFMPAAYAQVQPPPPAP